MSVSQSQTESGGLVGSSSRALLIPPGVGWGGVGGGVGVGGRPFAAFRFEIHSRSLQTLAGERPSEF